MGGLWCRPSFRFPPVDLPNWPAAAAPTKPAAVSLGASIAPPDISGAVLGLRKRPETQRRLCGRACLPGPVAATAHALPDAAEAPPFAAGPRGDPTDHCEITSLLPIFQS